MSQTYLVITHRGQFVNVRAFPLKVRIETKFSIDGGIFSKLLHLNYRVISSWTLIRDTTEVVKVSTFNTQPCKDGIYFDGFKRLREIVILDTSLYHVPYLFVLNCPNLQLFCIHDVFDYPMKTNDGRTHFKVKRCESLKEIYFGNDAIQYFNFFKLSSIEM